MYIKLYCILKYILYVTCNYVIIDDYHPRGQKIRRPSKNSRFVQNLKCAIEKLNPLYNNNSDISDHFLAA